MFKEAIVALSILGQPTDTRPQGNDRIGEVVALRRFANPKRTLPTANEQESLPLRQHRARSGLLALSV
jgi:hypothetical protein